MYDEYNAKIIISLNPEEIMYIESRIGRAIESDEDLCSVIKILIGI